MIMESIMAKTVYTISGLIGAVVYIIRGKYSVKESITILVSSTAVATFIAPAVVEYFKIESLNYIGAISFLFGLTGIVITGGIIDYAKNPEFIKNVFQKFTK